MVEFVSEPELEPTPASQAMKGNRQSQQRATTSPETKRSDQVPEPEASKAQASPVSVEVATLPVPIKRPQNMPRKKQVKSSASGKPELAGGRPDGKQRNPDDAALLDTTSRMKGPTGEETTKGVVRDLAAEDRWKQLLQAHLDRRKRYPAGALARRLEGTVLVRFSVAPDGALMGAEIQQSSEIAELDMEAIDLLHRASPVPIPPANVQTTVVAPINFSIRR